MAKKLDDPSGIAWQDAMGAICAYLRTSSFGEEVLDIRDPGPGIIEDLTREIRTPTGARSTTATVYTLPGVTVQVRKLDNGKEREAIYVFRFHWQGDRWKIVEPPGVVY